MAARASGVLLIARVEGLTKRRLESLSDASNGLPEPAQHQRRRQPQHPVAGAHQFPVTRHVSLCTRGVVLITVDLDDQASGRREEIHNGISNDDLTPEGNSKPLSTNAAPQGRLRRRRVETHVSSALLEEDLAGKTRGVKRLGLHEWIG